MTTVYLLLLILILEVSYLVYRTVQKTGFARRGGMLIDTSALMDGRIVTAAQSGFIPDVLIVPRSVINELQLLADQADHEKRSRARRGLDAIAELQGVSYLSVDVIDDGAVGKGGVDERLIDLAKRRNATICTIDFNLNKAATAMGIRVLNINELAGSLRMAFLPGETISMALTQKGQSGTQAVGYLADGTMVVVDKAASQLGKTVEIEFIRSLQTAAGRMMFAKLKNPEPEAKAPRTSGRSPAKNVDPTESKPTREKKASPQRSRRTPRSKDREASLIELVNNQE